MTLDTITQLARWIFLALGVGVIVWALFVRGRSKGRRRCPKCWYDMSATEGMRCPECGRAQKSERRFGKTRRSWRGAGAGGALLLLAYASDVAPDVRSGGWMFAVPRWALVLTTPFVELPDQTESLSWMSSRGRAAPGWGARGGASGASSLGVFERLYLHLYAERLGFASELWWWETRLVARDLLGVLDEPSPTDAGWNERFVSIVSSVCQDDIYDSRALVRSFAKQSLFGSPALEREGRVLRWVFQPHALLSYVLAFRSRDYEAETGAGEVWFSQDEGAGRWLKKTVYVPLHGPNRGRVTLELTPRDERRADGSVVPSSAVRVDFRLDEAVLRAYSDEP